MNVTGLGAAAAAAGSGGVFNQAGLHENACDFEGSKKDSLPHAQQLEGGWQGLAVLPPGP